MSFEAEFLTNGLAAVYFNGNLLGLIDQDYTTPGLQKYSYPLPEVFYDRPNALGFRLDGTNTGAAYMLVTNLTAAYFGLPEPAALQPSLADTNKLQVEISGISGHPYSFQSSSNLVDWVPVGIVLVTNAPAGSKGTVVYEDNVGAQNRRFLRRIPK